VDTTATNDQLVKQSLCFNGMIRGVKDAGKVDAGSDSVIIIA